MDGTTSYGGVVSIWRGRVSHKGDGVDSGERGGWVNVWIVVVEFKDGDGGEQIVKMMKGGGF